MKETILERVKFFSFILAAIFIGLPIYAFIFILVCLLCFLTPMDIPVWLITGKTPMCKLTGKLNGLIKDF